jgi:ATP-dependent DNA helicase RecG
LNAIVHKDYSSGIPIQISVYEDKIVLWNSGHLLPGWTLARLLGKHPSSPPNPLLANAFFRAGYIESWGRGIEKIRRARRTHGVEPPLYDFEMAGLMLTFRANPAHLPVAGLETGARGTPEKTPVETPVKTPVGIIEILSANPQMTLAEVATVIGRSASAVERAGAKLVKAGRLKHVGPRKGGHWEVLA